MEFNKSVSNPMLVGCIELLKEEDTPGHRNMFVEELVKSSLMSPSMIEPAPAEDEEGKLTIAPGSKVQFPMLTAPDGKRFFMAFTDSSEYGAWLEKSGQKLPYFALKFEDFAGMLFAKDSKGNMSQAAGYVINPVGANIVVPREMVAGILSVRAAQAKAKGSGTNPQKPQ